MKMCFRILFGCLCLFLVCTLVAQKPWTEEDRNYLLTQLKQTRDSLVLETKGLSEAQWNFKESPDRWSIKEVTEHIAVYELLLMHEVSKALAQKPDSARIPRADSLFVGFILEEKPHISVEYTKPFTHTLPTGLNSGKNNVAWFLKMRNESINFLDTTQRNIRLQYMSPIRPNVHQVYIYIFGHSERHLRQIRKIKKHQQYPAR